jgi:hypothetical protein
MRCSGNLADDDDVDSAVPQWEQKRPAATAPHAGQDVMSAVPHDAQNRASWVVDDPQVGQAVATSATLRL